MRIIITVLICVLIFSCKNDSKSNSNTEISGKNHKGKPVQIDVKTSLVNWFGYKILKNENLSHFGTISMKSGTFYIENGALTGGTFTADVTKLVVSDLEDSVLKSKLEKHLKEADFLNTSQFPEAKFDVTSVKQLSNEDFNTEITGNLTLKNTTKSISFKANVMNSEGKFAIFTEKFALNRADFNLTYNGTGESIITETFDLQIVLKGKP